MYILEIIFSDIEHQICMRKQSHIYAEPVRVFQKQSKNEQDKFLCKFFLGYFVSFSRMFFEKRCGEVMISWVLLLPILHIGNKKDVPQGQYRNPHNRLEVFCVSC